MKRILTTLSQKWPEYLIEAIVIVASILGAYTLDNWNDQRKVKLHEKEVLLALHNEFSENLKELHIDIARLEAQTEGLYKILNFFDSKTTPEEFELDSLISQSFANLTWNPSSFVLNDLKNSGQISKLSDQHLQLLLFDWERHYENLEEYKHGDLKSSDEFLKFLKEKGSMRNIDYTLSIYDNKEFSKSSFSFSNIELLKQLQFENMIDDKLATTLSLKKQYELTIGKIEEILKTSQP